MAFTVQYLSLCDAAAPEAVGSGKTHCRIMNREAAKQVSAAVGFDSFHQPLV
jgi:hypothetical protein